MLSALGRSTDSRHVTWLRHHVQACHGTNACLDMVLQASACLDTASRPSSMTCLDKVHWPSACLDTMNRPSASLDTVSQPSVMTYLDKVPWPSACIDMVTRPNA